jgi:hypothetical protein
MTTIVAAAQAQLAVEDASIEVLIDVIQLYAGKPIEELGVRYLF